MAGSSAPTSSSSTSNAPSSSTPPTSQASTGSVAAGTKRARSGKARAKAVKAEPGAAATTATPVQRKRKAGNATAAAGKPRRSATPRVKAEWHPWEEEKELAKPGPGASRDRSHEPPQPSELPPSPKPEGEEQPAEGLEVSDEEDVKPFERRAAPAARAPPAQLATANDVDDESKPDIDSDAADEGSVPSHHPDAETLRLVRKDPFPGHRQPPDSEYEAICDALAHAQDPGAPGPARNKWPAYETPRTEDRILYGLVRGILSVQVKYQRAHRRMDLLPRFGEPASDDEAYTPEARERHVKAPGREWEPVDWRRVQGWSHEKMTREVESCTNQTAKAHFVKGVLDKVDKWQKQKGITDGPLSLAWMRGGRAHKALQIYLSFKGCGLMTAQNQMSWVFGHKVLGVDSNGLRIARMLGWLPPTCNDANKAARHLNLRVPRKYRYALHQLFWKHGAACDMCCIKATSEVLPFTGTGVCPIEDLLDRRLAVAEGVVAPPPKPKKGGKSISALTQGGESEGGEEVDETGGEVIEVGDEDAEVEDAESEGVEEEEDAYVPSGKRRKVSDGTGAPLRRSGRRCDARPTVVTGAAEAGAVASPPAQESAPAASDLSAASQTPELDSAEDVLTLSSDEEETDAPATPAGSEQGMWAPPAAVAEDAKPSVKEEVEVIVIDD